MTDLDAKIKKLRKERRDLIEQRLYEIDEEIHELTLERYMLVDLQKANTIKQNDIIDEGLIDLMKQGKPVPHGGPNNPEIWKALNRLKDRGLIKNIGGKSRAVRWVLTEKAL